MNSIDTNGTVENLGFYLLTAISGWAANNWSTVIFVAIAVVHCYIALQKHRREQEAFEHRKAKLDKES